ncbi:unnamed protein product [Cochlearia groenlandica]
MNQPKDAKSNFADELYGESLNLSKSGNSNDHALENLDESVFGDSDNEESNESQVIERDSELRYNKFHSSGYRDGIIAGQEASAQLGYNVGYKESVLDGYKFGIVRGVLSAMAFLPDELKEKLSIEQETRDKFQELHTSVKAISTEVATKLFYASLMSRKRKEEEASLGSGGTAKTDELGSYVSELSSLLEKTPNVEVNFDTYRSC